MQSIYIKQSMQKDNFYFPNLNGVRSIAALMVIVGHIELNKSYFGLPNNFQNIKCLGELGVSLFFVLSGFLITYLLLREKGKYGKINIRSFYLRRVLRIWPLYYLVVLLSLFVLPNLSIFQMPYFHLDLDTNYQFFMVCFMFVFFLPNVLINLKLVPFATQTWSIGTEEQFYLAWPILIDRASDLKKWLFGIFLLYNLFLVVLSNSFLDDIRYIDLIRNYIHLMQLSALSLGAMTAFFLYTKNKFLSFFIRKEVFFIVFFLLLVSILYNVQIKFFSASFYSILFSILILNLTSNLDMTKSLENKIFIYLGKISYGMYMYHQMMIVLCIHFLQKWSIVSDFLIYVFSILATVLVSGLSYQFIEKPFLNYKEQFLTSHNSQPIINTPKYIS
jgi:peptidoglycan/LPS O-acetylase OafA/YrhL